jgi:outer membrane protein assembly factor BamB
VALGAAPQVDARPERADKLPAEPTPILPAEVAWTIRLDAPASAAGAIDLLRVYVPLQNGGLHAFERENGERLWTAGGATTREPVPGGAFVYTAGQDAIHAFDARTGGERWSVPLPSRPSASMVLAGEMLVVPTESGDLVAVDTNRRALAWRRALGATSVHRPAVLDAEIAVAISDGRVMLVDLGTGEPVWERSLPGALGAPAAGRDRVFIGSTNNFFYALHADSGREAWRWRTGGDVVGAGVAGDRVYFVSLDNVLRAVNRDNGNQQWKAEVPSRPSAPPIVVGDVVVLAGVAPRLDAFVGRTGDVLGNYTAPTDFQGVPAIDPDLQPFGVAIVAFTRDGTVTGLRPVRMLLPDPPPVPMLALPGRELPPDKPPPGGTSP